VLLRGKLVVKSNDPGGAAYVGDLELVAGRKSLSIAGISPGG
jgi:hypothetical protein